MDYSKTLQLPQTEFPMRGNLPNHEPNTLAWWQEINLYEQQRAVGRGKKRFILHDGPPFANGHIHIGHALNKVLKDFIVRYKSMAGFDAPFVPGWDTHGLPIETELAKKGVDRKTMSPLAYRERCEAYAMDVIVQQKEQFMRLGINGDWEDPYITLQPQYEAAQIRLFGEMVTNGLIYKGLRPVYWSPTSESALAEAEIEYQDKRSSSIYVAFPVFDGKGKLPEDAEIVIWTTTPWTIPANLGISLHPKFDYVLVQAGERKLLVAEGLLTEVGRVIGWSETTTLANFTGAELEGVVCRHPFYERDSIVMVGEHVTLETGTGCVHTAPGHGEDDFEIGKRYGLPVLCPVNESGVFTEEAPGFEGQYYDKANKLVTEKLEESGALLHLSFIQHQYPHDWRTKKPIIFRATEQWFASIDSIREKMLQNIKQVKWTPAWGEVRLHNMIADRGDWCISRQRAWGVPIPIFYCQSCNEPLVNEQTIEHVASIFESEGSNAWIAKEAQELLPAGITCKCGHGSFRKESDIMDVWFDSGSSHTAVLEQREELAWPADLYLEGSDQYRGWFNSSLITGVAVRGEAPYRGVLSTGFTLDGEGRKMSKSLGNTIDPLKVCNQLGADILRLWVSSVDYQSDVRISENILKQNSEAYRKIRNTLRFFMGNLADFNPDQHLVPVAQMDELDRFAMMKLQQMSERVRRAYELYQFHIVHQVIHHFCAVEMSAFYCEIIKDRLYCEQQDDLGRRASQTVLYEALHAIVRWIAPILPFTAEEVWRFTPGTAVQSVHLAEMPAPADLATFDQALDRKWSSFANIRDEVYRGLELARKEKIIGNGLSARLELYPVNSEVAELLQQMNDLPSLLIVSAVVVHNAGEHVPEQAFEGRLVQTVVKPAEGQKCERCWNVTLDVGQDQEHALLCHRCVTVVRAQG